MRFPILVIDEILDELAGTKFFQIWIWYQATIWCYHLVCKLPIDEHKTAFKTHHDYFQFQVMPFGLTNAPTTFQCLMNSVLDQFIRKFVLVFLDNILIYSPTMEQHISHH